MIVVEKKIYLFKINRVWFSNHIFDMKGCDTLIFSECKEKFNIEDFTLREKITSVIDLTQDIDKIWRSMKKKSCQYSIKRAERENIEIKRNERIEEFYQIFRYFNKEKKIMHLTESLPTLKKYGTLFIAEKDGEILCGKFFLEDEEIFMYWKAASKRPIMDNNKDKATLIGNASRLIIWEAIKYAKNKGIKEFNMGGLFAGEGTNYLVE